MLVQVADLGTVSSPALDGVNRTGFGRVERCALGFGTHGLGAHKECDDVHRDRQTNPINFGEAPKGQCLPLGRSALTIRQHYDAGASLLGQRERTNCLLSTHCGHSALL
jgi:hypothetical protein